MRYELQTVKKLERQLMGDHDAVLFSVAASALRGISDYIGENDIDQPSGDITITPFKRTDNVIRAKITYRNRVPADPAKDPRAVNKQKEINRLFDKIQKMGLARLGNLIDRNRR